MSSRDIRSEFAPIQDHIARFGLERTVRIAQAAASAVRSAMLAVGRAWTSLGAAMERGYSAELDRRAVEADAFLRRSAPRY
jgi:hypothetical protein